MLEAKDEFVKEKSIKIYKEGKRELKGYTYQSKIGASEQFGRKMIQEVIGIESCCGRKWVK